MKTRQTLALASTALLGLALAGCASSDPLAPAGESPSDGGSGDTIVIGSQAYYSNEIIAEIYSQALQNAGFEVEEKFNIGQRDAYMPSLESGEIDLFPEYSGSLLQQQYDPETTARTPDDVYAALVEALPEGLTALEQSAASDQDSYTVTAAFAEEHGLETIADLADVEGELTLGGPPELEERPYGPAGAKEIYGLDLAFSATGDTTVEDLLAGTIQVADVFTADPRIQTEDLVPLEDPEGLFLASNVVPIASSDIADEIAEVIDPISAALTPEGLVALNVQSVEEQMSPEDIAAGWLEEQGLL
ncbi:ABC transporter substrate-binding protein [Microbacterium sediminis]|uniref:Glycine/betaine ABC transporter n=1 Tax=Microbacterium sediminis TaxID=904291 RepID=A0A1B9NCS7_9MICO|nr:ABC transporter substrate-binding protein [Microbacterium sediminis]OCG74400.1 glycine/betaine ABC transporter [Microbacterium sediminis]QBR73770.1 ABC transporter substrate-binding protein [Microbacterium sediminis]